MLQGRHAVMLHSLCSLGSFISFVGPQRTHLICPSSSCGASGSHTSSPVDSTATCGLRCTLGGRAVETDGSAVDGTPL